MFTKVLQKYISDLNYFHCVQIVEILRDTEADTKNLFGMYGSQRMKDWQEIVRLYQNENVYLAEVANILLRNVKYEIPSVKKQITKLKQMQQVCILPEMYMNVYLLELNFEPRFLLGM